jgi:hypothetical protein
MDNQEKNKKKFYKRWWFWAIIVLVFIIIGSSGGNKAKDSDNNTSEQPAQSEAVTQESAIKVTAPQLLSEYEANEVAADAKYKNKMVEVSGTINSIGKDILDNPYVALNGNSPSLIFNVQCMFDKANQAQLATLTKDTSITLRGKVSGKMGNILINECSIVK